MAAVLRTCSMWKQAVDWAHEQDTRRAAEQERFARQRVLLQLETLWMMPAWSAPSSPGRL